MKIKAILVRAFLALFSVSALASERSAAGNITTLNVSASETCTPASCVELDITDKGTISVQVSGTYTGALTLQRSNDRITWTSLTASTTFTSVAGTQTATVGSGVTGTFAVANVAGFRWVRVTALAAVTGDARVVIYTAVPGGGNAGSSAGGGLTDAELRATPVPVSGTVTATPTGTQAISAASGTIASGAMVDIGTQADAAAPGDTTTASLIALAKRNNQNLTTLNTSVNADPNYSGVIGAATAPTRGLVGLGVYNSTPPTLTTGQSAARQVSSAGRALVDIQSNAPFNVAQINGVTPLMGNGVTGTGSPRVTPSSDSSAIANWGHGAIGSAIPAGATQIGIYDGTNLVRPATNAGDANTSTLRVAVATNASSAAVTLTRTADTVAYTANDVLGAATGSTAALTFSSMCPVSAGRVFLTTVSLQVNDTAVISGETSYRLYLYDVTPPSALGDNAAFDLPAGDRASYLGYVDLGTPVDLGSTLFVQSVNIDRQVKCSGTSLFGYLVTNGGYTPTASRVYVVTINAIGL